MRPDRLQLREFIFNYGYFAVLARYSKQKIPDRAMRQPDLEGAPGGQSRHQGVIGGKLAILKDIHQILEVPLAAQHSSHQTANRRGADD